jgi:hypothetical protein
MARAVSGNAVRERVQRHQCRPTCQGENMDLPVRFPSESEVILEDVARFRALSPQERFEAIRGRLNDGALILQNSPTAAWAKQYAEEQKNLEHRAIREFIERHGYSAPLGRTDPSGRSTL